MTANFPTNYGHKLHPFRATNLIDFHPIWPLFFTDRARAPNHDTPRSIVVFLALIFQTNISIFMSTEKTLLLPYVVVRTNFN